MIQLDDALVRKTAHGGVMGATDDVGIDPLTTKAIAEALELTHHASSSIASSRSGLVHHSHGGDMYPWRVSLRGLLALIIHETNRSDKEYRLSAARALSFLPWVSISGALAVLDTGSSSSSVGVGAAPAGAVASTDATGSMSLKQSNQKQPNDSNDAGVGMSIFDDYFEQLAALAGIPPFYAVAEEEMDSSTATTNGTTIDNKLQSLTKKVEKTGGRQPRGNALFGSRYGIDFNQKRNTLVNRRVTSTNVLGQGNNNDEETMLVTTGENHSAEGDGEVNAIASIQEAGAEGMMSDDLAEGLVGHEVVVMDVDVDVDPAVAGEHEMHVVAVENEHDGSIGTGGSGGLVHRATVPMMQGQTSTVDASATTVSMDVVVTVNETINDTVAVDTTSSASGNTGNSSSSSSSSSSNSILPSPAGLVLSPFHYPHHFLCIFR